MEIRTGAIDMAQNQGKTFQKGMEKNAELAKGLQDSSIVGMVKDGVKSYQEKGSVFEAVQDAVKAQVEKTKDNAEIIVEMAKNGIETNLESLKSLLD